jgi:hypothetical protein
LFIKNHSNETYLLYGSFFIILLLAFASKNIHIEPIDMSIIKRILHPEYPQGGVVYDPMYNYNYIVAYSAKILGYEADSIGLSRIFWFLEQALTLAVLVKLCDFVFNGDKLTLVLVIFTYLMLKSGETDQKTMLRPLHFLAIYYFLREKWILSSIFVASLFYLHVGIAIWWFAPSCFALCIMFYLNNKVNYKEVLSYPSVVLILALPVISFYLIMVQTGVNNFETNYLYYVFGGISSVVSLLTVNIKLLIFILITVAIFIVGYSKWTKFGYRNNCIIPIAMGVFFLYVVDFFLVDIFLSNTAIKLNLLRSIINIELFASLFFSFLIARQLRNGNIVFFAILLAFLFLKPFWSFFSVVNWWDALHAFYAVVIVYEIFELQISIVREKINLLFGSNSVFLQFKKTTNVIQYFVQNPVNLAGSFVVLYALLVTLSLSPIKPYAKLILGIQQKTGMNKSDSLHKDIARFTNEKIQGSDVILMFPFGKPEFEYYTNHKVFLTVQWLTGYIPTQIDKFQYIFENDLNYSIEKLGGGGSWDEIWRNINEKLLIKWRKEYGVTHVIRENELPLNFTVVYENEHYTIYDIRLLDNSQDGFKI